MWAEAHPQQTQTRCARVAVTPAPPAPNPTTFAASNPAEVARTDWLRPTVWSRPVQFTCTTLTQEAKSGAAGTAPLWGGNFGTEACRLCGRARARAGGTWGCQNLAAGTPEGSASRGTAAERCVHFFYLLVRAAFGLPGGLLGPAPRRGYVSGSLGINGTAAQVATAAAQQRRATAGRRGCCRPRGARAIPCTAGAPPLATGFGEWGPCSPPRRGCRAGGRASAQGAPHEAPRSKGGLHKKQNKAAAEHVRGAPRGRGG